MMKEKVSRREFLLTATGAVALSVALFRSAQGWMAKGRQYLGQGLAEPLSGRLTPPGDTKIDAVAQALNRWTFGPMPGEYARVSAMGVPAFLEEQLAPEQIEDGLCDRALARFSEAWWEPVGEHYEEDDEALPPILRRAMLLRAVYSKRQLFEVMCEFWSDHFNIDPTKGDCRYTKIDDDRMVVRAHALGNFREMLRASALSPAMLWYLDGRANAVRKPGDKPNENYARELMELHTLGVHGGYSQQDVMEAARCLTGWTVLAKKDDGFSGKLLSPLKDRGKVLFRADAHDDGAKRVLGREITAGGGAADLEKLIDIVVAHPGTAQHLATKLCLRFISDEPPAAAVDRVAAAFTASRYDIKATLRALFATPEFAASAGTKFKRPIHFIVSALRATNAQTDAAQPLLSYLEKMGQVPFRYPTPDGYPLAAAHWHATLLWRWKFAVALARNEIRGTSIDRGDLLEKLGDYDALAATLLNRRADEMERQAGADAGDRLALLLASPGFQRC